MQSGLLDSYDSTLNQYCLRTLEGLIGVAPGRVCSLQGTVGQNVRIGTAAKVWVDPDWKKSMDDSSVDGSGGEFEVIVSTIHPNLSSARIFTCNLNQSMEISCSAHSVPIGAVGQIVRFRDDIRCRYTGTRRVDFHGRVFLVKVGMLYVDVAVGLATPEAGTLADLGKLGVMMDGPNFECACIVCTLPLHCLEEVAEQEPASELVD